VNEAAHGLRGKKRLFTLSFSETVADTIVTSHTSRSEILIAESGPRSEGRALAEYLARHGVKVTVVADANIPSAVKEADAVLVGCDGITGDAAIVNKIGTRVAVEAAKSAGIPAYAVAQTFKIMPPDWPTFLEIQATGDWDESVPEVVGSPVFDLTPLSMFDAVFTEDGALTVERLTGVQTDLASVELIQGP
jgi:methylthioribose-1-phosphate isomerase